VLPLGLQLWVADIAGSMSFRVLPAMHERVRDNVRHILGSVAGDAEVERVARQQWRNYLRYLRDFVSLPHSRQADVERIFDNVDGWQHIVDVMDAGRGLVLVSAHFGSWDLAGAALAQRYPVNVIADSFNSARFDRLVNEYRQALRLKVIPIDKVVKRALTALKRNESLAFLVDKPVPGDDGVEVRFFGRTTRVPAGAAFFASRSGAPMVPAFVRRNADRSFAIKIYPPVRVDRGSDLGVAMQQVICCLEEIIRAHPEQWYMFRRMWPSGNESWEVGRETALITHSPSPTPRREAVA